MAVTTGRFVGDPRGFLSPSLHRQHKNICVPGVSPAQIESHVVQPKMPKILYLNGEPFLLRTFCLVH
jgi:hypothetical protein